MLAVFIEHRIDLIEQPRLLALRPPRRKARVRAFASYDVCLDPHGLSLRRLTMRLSALDSSILAAVRRVKPLEQSPGPVM